MRTLHEKADIVEYQLNIGGSFIFPQFVIFLRHFCVIATSISSKGGRPAILILGNTKKRTYEDWEIWKQGNLETGEY